MSDSNLTPLMYMLGLEQVFFRGRTQERGGDLSCLSVCGAHTFVVASVLSALRATQLASHRPVWGSAIIFELYRSTAPPNHTAHRGDGSPAARLSFCCTPVAGVSIRDGERASAK